MALEVTYCSKTFQQRKIDNLIHLMNLLSLFGVKKVNNLIVFEWDSPDIKQFTFLVKLLKKLTNSSFKGYYNQRTRNWIIEI